MAAGTLPIPGTDHGPCIDCQHSDCRNTRRMAATPCERCEAVIGYNTRFYRVDGGLVHARCEEQAVEAELAGGVR